MESTKHFLFVTCHISSKEHGLQQVHRILTTFLSSNPLRTGLSLHLRYPSKFNETRIYTLIIPGLCYIKFANVGPGFIKKGTTIEVASSCRHKGILYTCNSLHESFQIFFFPENTGFPIGGSNQPSYMFLEIHYDNQGFRSGK